MSNQQTRPMLSEPDLSGLPIYLSDRHALWLSPGDRARGRTTWVQGLLRYVQCSYTIIEDDATGSKEVEWGSVPEQPDPLHYGKVGVGSARIMPDGWATGPWPWDWNPHKEGEAIFANRKPRAHEEGVAWCRSCRMVARTSPEIAHHWRCKKPDVVGCYLPAVLDGPGVLKKSIAVHVDDRGRTYLLGPAVNGTGAATISEQTPELWQWNKIRRNQRTPNVTLGHVDFWVPTLPVAWITAKQQFHELRYSAVQSTRYQMVQAVGGWLSHSAAGSMSMEPLEAARWWKQRYPNVTFYPDTESIQKEYDRVTSWAKQSMWTALDGLEPPPNPIPVHRDGVLKGDLTPYTGNRGPKQIIAKQSADSAERRLEADRMRKEAAREAARKMLEDGAIG